MKDQMDRSSRASTLANNSRISLSPEPASGRGPAVDPFFNANRPEDLDRAAALLDRLEL